LLDRRSGAAASLQPKPRRGIPAGARAPRLTAETKQALLAALQAGESASDLAHKHGCSLGTVMTLKRKAGLTKPRR
jgi:transposase-like protein